MILKILKYALDSLFVCLFVFKYDLFKSSIIYLNAQLIFQTFELITFFVLIDSKHANDIEVFVILVPPERRVAKVRIVEELSATLCPSDRLSLGVTVNHCRIYWRKQRDSSVKEKTCQCLMFDVTYRERSSA